MVSLVYEGEEARLIWSEMNSPLTLIAPSFFFLPKLVSTTIDSSSAEANRTKEPNLCRLGIQELMRVIV